MTIGFEPVRCNDGIVGGTLGWAARRERGEGNGGDGCTFLISSFYLVKDTKWP